MSNAIKVIPYFTTI